jgi:transcriptional repressor NrdR
MSRFTTYEQSAFTYPKVVKRDGSLAPFDEGKIRKGVLKALEKRPMAHDICEKVMARIVSEVLHGANREISTAQIGDYAMACLLEMDHIAYVRFASVYKSFETLDVFNSFINELRPKLEEVS